MDFRLMGRRALVTAASRGLGGACAEALATEGASVFTAARDEAALIRMNHRIRGAGYRVTDVTQRDQVEALVLAATEAMGGLDILVVNAGGAPPGTIEQVDDDAWQRAFTLTTMSAVWLWRTSLPYLKESSQGRIVNITSGYVKEPSNLLMLSNAFRPGVTAVAKMLATELAPTGVTVNCIGPGSILTDRTRSIAQVAADANGRSLEAQIESNAAAMPMRRYGDPAELGALCAFLCSGPAGYITGQTIIIDGGIGRSIF